MTEAHEELAVAHTAWQAAYERHVAAVGEVVFHWNLLHERLGELFGIAADTSPHVGMAIWYALQSDVAQREILLAALRASETDEARWKLRPQAPGDIRWVLKHINEKLRDQRNDAIHAPCEEALAIFERPDGSKFPAFEVGPSFYLGNPRATKLSQKDLVPEFLWYAETGQVLTRFCTEMLAALKFGGSAPWPDKPTLPQLRPSQNRRA